MRGGVSLFRSVLCREWRTSFNLKWTDNETVVHYDLNTTYTLERDMSSGDPTKDTITTLNIPLYVCR